MSGESQRSVPVVELPRSDTSGPRFECPGCFRTVVTYEWRVDLDAPGGNTFSCRCACGRRYRWRRGALYVDAVITHWRRYHATGDVAEIEYAMVTGEYRYAVYRDGHRPVRWFGPVWSLADAQHRAEGAIGDHDCRCPPWHGTP